MLNKLDYGDEVHQKVIFNTDLVSVPTMLEL